MVYLYIVFKHNKVIVINDVFSKSHTYQTADVAMLVNMVSYEVDRIWSFSSDSRIYNADNPITTPKENLSAGYLNSYRIIYSWEIRSLFEFLERTVAMNLPEYFKVQSRQSPSRAIVGYIVRRKQKR